MTVKEILPGMVLRSDYDALAARLAEAERLLRELPVACACECLADVKAAVDSFLRAADNGPAYRSDGTLREDWPLDLEGRPRDPNYCPKCVDLGYCRCPIASSE